MKEYKYKVQGVDYEVNIEDVQGNIAKVTVNGKEFEVEMNHPMRPTHKSLSKPVVAAPTAPAAASVQAAPAAAKPAAATGAGVKVKSPLPGTITSVNVAA